MMALTTYIIDKILNNLKLTLVVFKCLTKYFNHQLHYFLQFFFVINSFIVMFVSVPCDLSKVKNQRQLWISIYFR